MKKRSIEQGRATTQSRLVAYFYNFNKRYINEFMDPKNSRER